MALGNDRDGWRFVSALFRAYDDPRGSTDPGPTAAAWVRRGAFR